MRAPPSQQLPSNSGIRVSAQDRDFTSYQNNIDELADEQEAMEDLYDAELQEAEDQMMKEIMQLSALEAAKNAGQLKFDFKRSNKKDKSSEHSKKPSNFAIPPPSMPLSARVPGTNDAS